MHIVFFINVDPLLVLITIKSYKVTLKKFKVFPNISPKSTSMSLTMEDSSCCLASATFDHRL